MEEKAILTHSQNDALNTYLSEWIDQYAAGFPSPPNGLDKAEVAGMRMLQRHILNMPEIDDQDHNDPQAVTGWSMVVPPVRIHLGQAIALREKLLELGFTIAGNHARAAMFAIHRPSTTSADNIDEWDEVLAWAQRLVEVAAECEKPEPF